MIERGRPQTQNISVQNAKQIVRFKATTPPSPQSDRILLKCPKRQNILHFGRLCAMLFERPRAGVSTKRTKLDVFGRTSLIDDHLIYIYI